MREDDGSSRGLLLREKLSKSGCQFEAAVTSDFGDATYVFSLRCSFTVDGKMQFAVVSPVEIADISGTISGEKGELVFDDTILAFPTLADGDLSPVSAPWHVIRALKSGYLSSVVTDNNRLSMTIDDTFSSEPLRVVIRLDASDLPEYAEIFWNGRMILCTHISGFTYV